MNPYCHVFFGNLMQTEIRKDPYNLVAGSRDQ